MKADEIIRVLLGESSESQSYQRLWQEASSFMSEKENEVVDLPQDSPEKLRIMAITGVLQKYKPDDTDNPQTIRTKLNSLGNGVEELSSSGSGDSGGGTLQKYIKELVRGARELYTQIDPAGAEPQESPPNEGKPNAEKDAESSHDETAQEPEALSDKEELAQALGIHESVSLLRGMKKTGCLSENELKPGQVVVRVVNGEMKRLQVVRDENGKVSLVDPDQLTTDKADRKEVAPYDQDKSNGEIRQ